MLERIKKMTSLQPTVSVVTPFYNCGEYLEQCIRSVLSQSYSDFEYILVDNRSSDNSAEIARKYAEKDKRIRLYSNEECLNQVQNYNHALSMISSGSTYCKMVQADDWIFRTCLEEMVSVADRDANVGIVSSYRMKGSQIKNIGLSHTSQIVPGRDICRMQLLDGYFFFGSPTTIMYRSEVVRNRKRFFVEGRLHEDTEACYEILKNWDFGFVHQVLSFTRVDNESTMSSVRSFNPELLDKLIVLKEFGAYYLDPDEFRDAWAKIENRYLRYLAESKCRGKGREFWNYHQRGLATIGYSVKAYRLYWQMLGWIVDMALNPKNTVERLLNSRASRPNRAS